MKLQLIPHNGFSSLSIYIVRLTQRSLRHFVDRLALELIR